MLDDVNVHHHERLFGWMDGWMEKKGGMNDVEFRHILTLNSMIF